MKAFSTKLINIRGGIAKKENIVAEDDALHLIAQKADGALRDALSMFDLIVTYSSDNKITYQNTISNLHILDYDYYFKVTDQLLGKDHSGALLTFEEILSRGFDGHNFIVGLGEHLRNLMVSRDKSTVVLLQVSEGVKKKYYEQAQRLSLSYLLSALNLTNQCDIYYKSSKNQRLHVELTLMKLAHLSSAINLSTLSPDELKKKSEIGK